MSSGRGHRRPAAPTSLAPQQKQVISVEEWEAKAPLGDIELRSVDFVKAAAEKSPLPLKFDADDVSSPRPSSPALRSKFDPNSRPSTPNPNPARLLATHALHPKQPVQTPQQFYDWFSLIDRSVAHSQESHFRAHAATVAEHLETCDRLIQTIDMVNSEVDGMLEGWKSVEESGKSLKDACERLLLERDKLTGLTDDIGSRLEYFQELEHATRTLNHPGEALVLQADFLDMVERVDVCIDYLKAHRHFKEAEIYLLRFQQCMTRAMTLINMYFVGALRALTVDVSKRLTEQDVSSTAQMHLLYTRFRSVSMQLAPLLAELERRAQSHPAELSALLSECHAAYFSTRKTLLVGGLMEEIKGLDPARTELVELTRAGCSYLKHLCTDEFNLYREFFNSGEDQLYQYLENLCDYLYDDLRPRILHEPRLTALCEVCTVLQALMVLDVPLASTEDDDPEDELTIDLEHPRRKGLSKLHISQLLQMVLQDAQTRLFFKAQSVIQADIRYYSPKAEDLAYPDKLLTTRNLTTPLEVKEKESISQIFQLRSLNKHDTWFPTLQKTMWVLSQLHDFVKPAIFEDIAQEAVSLCRQSLVVASDMIKQRNPPSSALDGQLFLVRHLLILKEMTHNLDLGQKEAEPTFGVTETLSSMLSKTTSLLPNALFASLGMPRAEESITEAKHGIDHELQRACEELITRCADPICEPVRTWVKRIREQTTDRQTPLASEPWVQQPVAEELDKNFRMACERDFRASVARLRLYLEDDRTVGILVGHIQDSIVEDYEAFRDVSGSMYAGALRGVVLSSPGLREVLKGVCAGEDRPATVY